MDLYYSISPYWAALPVILSAAKNLASTICGFFATLRMTGIMIDDGFGVTYVCLRKTIVGYD